MKEGSLDMRMDQDQSLSAYDVVNKYKESDLVNIFYKYGEEKFSRQIASNIVSTRETSKINTTLELAEIVRNSVPQKVRRDKNPCKKTFQAIRIAVNGELDHLSKGIDEAFSLAARRTRRGLDHGGGLDGGGCRLYGARGRSRRAFPAGAKAAGHGRSGRHQRRKRPSQRPGRGRGDRSRQ